MVGGLEQLETMVCNWKELTMQFQYWKNQTHKLQGLNAQPIQSTSLISKKLWQGHSMFFICLQITANKHDVYLDMQHLIKAFEDIFLEPKQLPPTREIDHCVTLNEGTEPINMRSYRYVYFLKANKIKKQFMTC
jgi:hypothetical protein